MALHGLIRLETARWNWDRAAAYGERAMALASSLSADDENQEIYLRLALAWLDIYRDGDLHGARSRVAALIPRAQAYDRLVS